MASVKATGTIEKDAVVRRASVHDADAILSIGDFYDGLDKLTAVLTDNLKDPNMLCYVLEISGQIVAYMEYFLVDDGATMIGMSARTAPEYRKIGVTTMIRMRSTQDAMATWPSVWRTRATSVNNDYWQQKRRAGTIEFEINHRRIESKVAWEIEADQLQKVVKKWLHTPAKSNRSHSLHQVSSTELVRVLRSKSAQLMLFPKTFVSVDRLFFDLIESNFHLVSKYSTQAFMSTNSGGVPQALSLCRPLVCPRGLLCLVDYHGEQEPETYCDHVMHHCEFALREFTSGKIFVSARVDDDMDMDAVKDILSSVNLSEGGDFIDYVLYLTFPFKLPKSSKL